MKTITAEHVESFRKVHYELIDRPSFGWTTGSYSGRSFRWVMQGIGLLCGKIANGEWHAQIARNSCFDDDRYAIVTATGRTRAEAALNALDAAISKAFKS